MKRFVFLFFAILFFFCFNPTTTKAQGFDKGKIYVDLGVGVPRSSYGGLYSYGYGYSGYSRTPGFKVDVLYGFNDFISGGIYFGFQHSGYKETDYWDYNNSYVEKHSYNRFTIAVGASFHVWSFLNTTLDLGLGVNKLDLYVTPLAGADIHAYKEKDMGGPGHVTKSSNVDPFFGGTVGAKYYFLDWLAVYIEAGYNVSTVFEGGLTFKF